MPTNELNKKNRPIHSPTMNVIGSRIEVSDANLQTAEQVRSFIRMFGASEYERAAEFLASKRIPKGAAAERKARGLSPDEYAKKREEILSELEPEVPNDKEVKVEVEYRPERREAPLTDHWNDLKTLFSGESEVTIHSKAMHLMNLSGLDTADPKFLRNLTNEPEYSTGAKSLNPESHGDIKVTG